MRTTSSSISELTLGRPGERRCFEPSNFAAISLRYQPGMVSGLAMRATCCSPFRPGRLPISASVALSPSDSPQAGPQVSSQNPVLGRQILILKQQFLIDQSGIEVTRIADDRLGTQRSSLFEILLDPRRLV